MKRLFFLFLIVITTISACTPPPTQAPIQTAAPAASAYPPADSSGASPYPSANGTGAYPYPAPAMQLQTAAPYPGAEVAPATQTPYATVTPNPALGQVKGRLLEGSTPYTDAIIYLAQVKADEQGNELAAKITSDAPFTTTDADGNFLFINVPAGRYALILDVVLNAYLLNVPGTEQAVLVTVENGKIADVGTLAYEDLPRK